MAKELILLFLRMIEEDESRLSLILPCEGNATSTWMIQILGPCTFNVSCNIRAWINTLVCVRPLYARSRCASYECYTHVRRARARIQSSVCRSTPNIYTSIHSRLVEGRDPDGCRFLPFKFRSAVFAALRVRMEDLPDLRQKPRKACN